MSVQEVQIGKLVFEEKLYPRKNVDVHHISRLEDALRAGSVFPPVIADDKRYVLIDGVHRSRAWGKVYGEDAKIPCQLVTADDAEIFRMAVENNTAHGLSLDAYERTNCLLRFCELGISRDVALRALRMTAEKAERVIQTKTAFRITPDGSKQQIAIKGTMHNFRGETLTKRQQAANEKAGGMRFHYYLSQMIELVEAGICDRIEGKVLDNLHHLRDLLNENLPRKKKKSA